MLAQLRALHNEIAELETQLRDKIVGQDKVVKNCDKIVTSMDEDVLRVTIFDGPAHVSTSIIEPGLIVRYCGGRQLTTKQREKLAKEIGL